MFGFRANLVSSFHVFSMNNCLNCLCGLYAKAITCFFDCFDMIGSNCTQMPSNWKRVKKFRSSRILALNFFGLRRSVSPPKF